MNEYIKSRGWGYKPYLTRARTTGENFRYDLHCICNEVIYGLGGNERTAVREAYQAMRIHIANKHRETIS